MKLKALILSVVIAACTVIYSCVSPVAKQYEAPDLAEYFKDTTSVPKTGGVQMVTINTPKGKFRVWTKKLGNSSTMKLLLLNGGPGLTHDVFECMESYLPAKGIELIYYDQLGCGNSDNPKDTTMWDLPRYVEEVEQVRQALHLDKDNFYLLGHSWGGLLAMEYAVKYQQHIKGMIISNMMASVPEYGKYADNVLAKQMDPKVLARIREIEAKKDFENPEYMQLLIPNFYEKHLLRLPQDKWPEPLFRSLAKENQSLYVTMQGPSEFGVAGKLVKWDRSKDLSKISTPTLVIGAQYDTMDPKYMQWMATQFPNGSYLYCEKGSHMAMYDDQKTYMRGLTRFIRGVNSGEKKVEL